MSENIPTVGDGNEETGVTGAIKGYYEGVKAKPGHHAVSALIGAVVMRAVDTRAIRKNLGSATADSVRKAIPLGSIPLING